MRWSLSAAASVQPSPTPSRAAAFEKETSDEGRGGGLQAAVRRANGSKEDDFGLETKATSAAGARSLHRLELGACDLGFVHRTASSCRPGGGKCWQRNNFSVISGRLWDRILLFLTWDGVRAKPERRPRKHRRSSLGSERGTPCGGGVPHNKLDRSSCVFSAINRSHCGPVEIGEFVYK